jgi:GNAT superfamily N-acetyltransferase
LVGLKVVPLREITLDSTAKLCAASLAQTAQRIGQPWLRPPADRGEQPVETMLRRYLHGEADGRLGWTVIDSGGSVRAFAGATFLDLVPEDPRYTYMPPRSVGVTATACHADSPQAASVCYPLLFDTLWEHADQQATPRLLVQTNPADPTAGVWRELGLRPDVTMAVQPVRAWQTVPSPPPGIRVRRADPDDLEALTELALEEHHYHAHHTTSGTSRYQPRQTSRRMAAEAISAPDGMTCQLVAERAGPSAAPATPLGSIVGTIHELVDDQLTRYLLPPRYGYIGLTSVTADARGSGVGRALVDALMRWFAANQVDIAFLHFVVDNPLSAPFWARLGFAPHLETMGMWRSELPAERGPDEQARPCGDHHDHRRWDTGPAR